MKKSVLYFLSSCLLCATTITARAQGGPIKDADLSWNFEKGTLTISGEGEMPDYENGSIPWANYRPDVNSVIIENDVTSIGKYAFFNFPQLREITIGESVKTIGEAAFAECSALIVVTNYAPDPQDVSAKVFSGVPLNENVVLYVPLGYAERYLKAEIWKDFASIEELTENGDCEPQTEGKLTWIFCDGGLIVSGEGPMPEYKSGDFPWANIQHLISFVYVDGLTSIADYAFSGFDRLFSVSIGESVETIGANAFSFCLKLEFVTIGEKVTSIGQMAFAYCEGLTNVYNYAAAPQNILNNHVFLTLKLSDIMLHVPRCSEKFYRDAQVWKDFNVAPMQGWDVCDLEFADDFFLYKVIDGTTNVSIGWGGFQNFCLETLNIPSHAFYNDITYTVTEIREESFSTCFESVVSITIPETITSIGDFAFADYQKLASVTVFWADPIEISEIVFANVKLENVQLFIPQGTSDAYHKAFIWNEFEIVEEIDSGDCVPRTEERITWVVCEGTLTIGGVGSIPDYEYETMPWADYRPAITSVVIEEGINNIGKFAFVDFQEIKSVHIGKTVSSIGEGAFGNCIGLTEIYNYAISPQWIECGIFYCWDGIDPENVTLNVPLISVEKYRDAEVWKEFANIEPISGSGGDCMPRETENITWIFCEGRLTIGGEGEMPDYEWGEQPWHSIQEAIIAVDIQGVSRIGNGAFQNCSNLTDVNISNSVLSIGESAFANCMGLKSITIGESVETIGDFAFNFCVNLESVIISKSVTSIGKNIFQSCYALKDVFNYAAIPQPITMNDNVFPIFGPDNDLTLHVPACSETLYRNAEVWNLFNIFPMEGGDECETEFFDDFFLYRIIEGTTNVSIGWGGFQNFCLEILDIPSHTIYNDITFTVTEIREESFSSCFESVVSITIPETITAIGDFAFANYQNLVSVTVYWANPIEISELVFGDADLRSIQLFVPQGTFDAYFAADVWKEFEIIIINGSDCDPRIEEGFTWTICEGTLTISGDGPMPDFENGAMPWANYRPAVTSVVIEEGVYSIGKFAFVGFQEIKSIYIGKTVSSIGEGAFGNCIGLTEIYNYAIYPKLIDCNVFFCWDGIDPKDVTLYVPLVSVEKYREADVWKEFANIEPIPGSGGDCLPRETENITWILCEGTLTIGGEGEMPDYEWGEQPWHSFQETITAVDIQGVSRIGNRAFEGCPNLTSVNISNSVLAIGEWAFANCFGLKSITIGESVEMIESFAFTFCQNLETAVISKSVKSIGDNAFQSCYNLAEAFNYALEPQPISMNVFAVGPNNIRLHVPVCSETLYREAEVWKDFNIAPMESDDCVTGAYAVAFSVEGEYGTITATVDDEEIESGAWVEEGKNILFTAAPDENYRVKAWTINNATINNKLNTYTLENLSAAATVTVEFEFVPVTEQVYSLEMIEGEIYVAVEINISQGGKVEWTQEYDSQNGNLFLFKFYLESNDVIRSLDCIVYGANGIIEARYAVNVQSSRIRIATNPAVTNAKVSVYVKMRSDDVDLLEVIDATNTDGGIYVSKELPEGEYIVSVDAPNYLFTYYNAGDNVIVNWTDEDITWITLADGVDEAIAVRLAQMTNQTGTITISGKLIDLSMLKASVVPISKSTVVLSAGSVVKSTDVIVWTVIATTVPDRDGKYSFAGLPPGLYRVTVEIAGFGLEGDKIIDATSGSKNEITDQDFSIDDETKTVSAVTYTVTGVSLNKTTLKLFIDDQEILIPAFNPTNASNKAVTWSSSSSTIATVSDEGLVTAKAIGTATITVRTVDGNHPAQCVVTVEKKQVTDVEIADAPFARAYPNPTDGIVTLEFEADGIYVVSLADLNGKTLLRKTVADQTVQIDLGGYPAGVFMLVIDDGKRQSATRIIKY